MADDQQRTDVNIDRRAVSGAELGADRAFRAMREDASVQNTITQDSIRDKMASAIRDAAPLIAGLGLLQQTDSPALAIGGAYITDKIKDQLEARAARRKAEKQEMKQRRLAAQIAVKQGKFQSEEDAMQAIAGNRLVQEDQRIADEQEELMRKMGIIDAEGETVDQQQANAEQESDILDQAEANAQRHSELLGIDPDTTAGVAPAPDTAETVERAEPGSRAEMTAALRELSAEDQSKLGIETQGTDQAIVDGETGRPLSNKAMEDALANHQENLANIDANIGHLVDIQSDAAVDANKDRLAEKESAREKARGVGQVPGAPGGGDDGDDDEGGGLLSRFRNRRGRNKGGRNTKPSKGGGSKGGNKGIGGTLGKLVGGFAGGAIAAFVQALGNPMMAKAAAIFAIAAPLIGIGIAGFIFAVSLGIAGASWIMGKALPTLSEGLATLQPVLKKFEELDGNKLSGAASGMKSMLLGFGAVGIGGLISKLANAHQLSDLATALKDFEKIDGKKLTEVGPGMVALGKGMGAAGMGAVFTGLSEWVTGKSTKQTFIDLAAGLNAFSTVDTVKLPLIGPAVKSLGDGMKTAAGGGLFTAVADWVSGKGTKQQYIDLAEGLQAFATVDAVKITAIGPAVKALGEGMSATGMGAITGAVAKFIGGKGTKQQFVDLAGGLEAFGNVDGEKLKLVGPAVKQLGEGMGSQSMSGLTNAISSFFGGKGTKEQFKDLADGLGYFATIDPTKITLVGPAVKSLAESLKVMNEGKGLKSAIGGLIEGFGSWVFGDKNDPVEKIKKFGDSLGSPEVNQKLILAGQGIRFFADGVKGLKEIQDMPDMSNIPVEPLEKIFVAFGKMGPEAGLQFKKTIKAFHSLRGLETIDWATMGPGLKTLGHGFDQFADYVNDGEIKTIGEASEAIKRFSQAMQAFQKAAAMKEIVTKLKRENEAGTAEKAPKNKGALDFQMGFKTKKMSIAGKPWAPGQPLSRTQMYAVETAISMGNQPLPEVMAAYDKSKAAQAAAQGNQTGQQLNARSGDGALAAGNQPQSENQMTINQINNAKTTHDHRQSDIRTRSNDSTLAKKAWRSTHLNFGTG